ncbi:M56 family metallopeptidase [Specibacter cremeus]|uniref:M56 family metallopeptidase n=1 Tax=Specibacter cremeus TaxID=1629051 RepID=UPI000F7A7EF6|nr:M56 family metallopeptidase [Specibacter cremeus]
MTEQQLPQHLRVHVLAYPAPTTGRFLIFVLALLTAGLFVGDWLHNQSLGAAWTRTVYECESAAAGSGAGLPPGEALLTRTAAAQRCEAPAEQGRALWSLGGAAGAAAAGIAVMYIAPQVIRRRRRLAPPRPGLAAMARHFDELSDQAGMRHHPALAIGPAGQRDAFCFGVPGRYVVALPKGAAVRWRDPTVFDALVRHELAHVRHHDVALSWLARSIWYVLGPVLLLPVVRGLVFGDLSLFPDYAWRAALLAVAVELTAAALLRTREHDADLAAARGGQNLADLRTCLGRLPATRPTHGWNRMRARHPSAQRRRDVVEAPEMAARLRFLDAATAAFLAALSVPLVVAALVPLLAGTGGTSFADLAAALLTGPLIGTAVGLALWRSAAMTRAAGGQAGVRDRTAARAAAGVGVGFAIGHVASLGQIGSQPADVLLDPWIVVAMVLGAGTVVLSAGLGDVWADALRGLRHPWQAWGTALAANMVLFTAAAWIWGRIQLSLEDLGWVAARIWLVTGLAEPVLVSAIAVVAGVAAVGLLRRSRNAARPLPSWLFDGPAIVPSAGVRPAVRSIRFAESSRAAIACGLACGTLTTAVLVARRVLAGPADTDAVREDRLWTSIWVCAAAWCAVSIAAMLSRSRAGAATSVVGGFIAAATGVAGFVALNTALGGSLTWQFVGFVLWPAIGLGFVLALIAGALAAALPPPWRPRAGRGLALTVVAGAAALVLGTVVVIAGRSFTGSFAEAIGSAAGQVAGSTAAVDDAAEAQWYTTQLAPAVIDAYSGVLAQVQTAEGMVGQDPAGAMTILQLEVIPALSDLETAARAFVPTSKAVSTVHADLLAAIPLTREEFTQVANAITNGDRAAADLALQLRAQERQLWKRWLDGVERLKSAAAAS